MGIVKTRQSRVSQIIFFIPKMVQDYGNRTADTFLTMLELGRWGILSLGGCYYIYGSQGRRQRLIAFAIKATPFKSDFNFFCFLKNGIAY